MHFRSPIPPVNFELPAGQRTRKALSVQRIQVGVSNIWVAVLLHLFFTWPFELLATACSVQKQSKSKKIKCNRTMIWEISFIKGRILFNVSSLFVRLYCFHSLFRLLHANCDVGKSSSCCRLVSDVKQVHLYHIYVCIHSKYLVTGGLSNSNSNVCACCAVCNKLLSCCNMQVKWW